MGGDGRGGKNLTVLDGSTFFVSDPSGDVEAEHADGFFHADMRHLSTWRLFVDGESPRTLSSETVDYYSARVIGGVSRDGEDATTAVRRERFVSGGCTRTSSSKTSRTVRSAWSSSSSSPRTSATSWSVTSARRSAVGSHGTWASER
ncbi:MAG: hypothetical protein H0U82_01355 [Actinobacteria bacterium]|nr:hypothetical protein [Actinomycetota bacterium]